MNEAKNSRSAQLPKLTELCKNLGIYSTRYYELLAKENSGRSLIEKMKMNTQDSSSIQIQR